MEAFKESLENNVDKENFDVKLMFKKLFEEYIVLLDKLENRQKHISYLEDLIDEQRFWILKLTSDNRKKSPLKSSIKSPISTKIVSVKNVNDEMTDEAIMEELSVRDKILALEEVCLIDHNHNDCSNKVSLEGCSGGRIKYTIKS